MNDKMSKRNRSGNFDQDDTDLFLSLVNEHKALIESNKQEDKKKVLYPYFKTLSLKNKKT